MCGKVLNCGKHACKKKCHAGKCEDCPEKILVSCFCGKKQIETTCGNLKVSCHQVCGKTLDCGNH